MEMNVVRQPYDANLFDGVLTLWQQKKSCLKILNLFCFKNISFLNRSVTSQPLSIDFCCCHHFPWCYWRCLALFPLFLKKRTNTLSYILFVINTNTVLFCLGLYQTFLGLIISTASFTPIWLLNFGNIHGSSWFHTYGIKSQNNNLLCTGLPKNGSCSISKDPEGVTPQVFVLCQHFEEDFCFPFFCRTIFFFFF